MNRMIVLVLLTASMGCTAADQNPTVENVPSADALTPLAGEWMPGSRNYEATLGRFRIADDSIVFDECPRPIKILNDEIRHDRQWKGLGEEKEARLYRDVVVRILPNPTCSTGSERIFRFLLMEVDQCFATLMVYASQSDFEVNRRSWGGYHNQTCHAGHQTDEKN